MHLHAPTENRSRLSFARICIEVALNCDFPKSALLSFGNDKYITVRIEYPWVPHSCSQCKVYGHKATHCPIFKAMNAKAASEGSNISAGKVGESGKSSGKNEVAGASLQREFKQNKDPAGNQKDPDKDSLEGVDSIIESIIVHPSMISQDGPVQVGAEVNASLISANTRPQPVRIGSKFDNKFDGRGNGATAAVLHSNDHKVSHKWRSLFANRPKSCSQLAYYNPSTLDGKVTINPPPEAVVEGVGIWEGSLVGQFLDKRLPLHLVKSFVGRLWGNHEIPEISTTDNGLYIFRFKDLDARDWVLENGPWYFAGRPNILRFWKPGMEMLNVQITSLPIWVKFFNIPLEYWTVTSLGYIASAVGIPLHLDTLTENHSRLSFARICIEVNVNCTFPKSALLDLGNGKYSTIRIEYPWVPQNCTHCKIFGHSHVKCQGMKEMVDSKTNRLNHVDRRQ